MTSNLRPLQPAPSDQESAPQQQTRPLLTQKPKRTVTLGACVACRKRKSKCDGQRPVCACCTQKDTECVYELGPNEKPSQAIKRKNEEMQAELSNLRHLYEFLRVRPEQEALEIFKRIRANSPTTTSAQRIQELVDCVRQGNLPVQPMVLQPTHQWDNLSLPPLRLALESSSSESSSFLRGVSFSSGVSPADSDAPSSQRRRHHSDADVSARSESQGSLPRSVSITSILHESLPYIMDRAVDSRLESARHWTNVISDRSLLTHLMSAWYSWEYKYYHFLDWDIFLEDMSARRDDFCSELLVNAILASASFQSPMIKDRTKPFSDSTMTRLYKEARRLWDIGEGRATLPRIQAAMLLFLILGKHGRDKVGHMFLAEGCRMALDLGLFRVLPAASTAHAQEAPRKKLERVRAVTAWALFNFQISMALTIPFPILLKMQPPISIPYDDTQDVEEFFRSECGRHIIMLDCAHSFAYVDDRGSKIPPNPEQVEVLYLKMKSWWDSRPESLEPTENSSPENLLAAMQYHVCIIRILRPYLNDAGSRERAKSYADRVDSTVSNSIKELRRLLALHDVRHGWLNAIPYILHPIMICSFGTLEELVAENRPPDSREISEPYKGIITCLRALSSLSCFVFIAQPLFRLLTQTCQSLNIQLPIEALSTLDYYRSDEWTKMASNIVRSQYVADSIKTVPGIQMDAIISQWDAMTLENKNGQSASRSASSSSLLTQEDWLSTSRTTSRESALNQESQKF
ncbi:hypothetical protein CC78DRAFT_575010 [Lojkania enalia]|uniref:Zn(2)-C6 fungal-type domain-containing protein n=1 Tax=Lojkania enalia TaxID=147567 RepID=A0A9P4NA87_9PLEO|nr:hypothetical protein CC78DRAFT_575010 [Didymosphaeria enalia]